MRQLWGRVRDSVEGARWPFLAAVAVIVIVVVPWRTYQDHSHWARVLWVPFSSPPIKASDIVGNVLLYMPLGYFAWTQGRARLATVVVVALLLSAVTEASQLYSHGRFPSAGDIVCNVAGAWIGALLRRWRSD